MASALFPLSLGDRSSKVLKSLSGALPPLSGTPISSNPYGGNYSAYGPDFAFDGNLATFFASDDPQGVGYLGLDLADRYDIKKVGVIVRTGFNDQLNGANICVAMSADLSDEVVIGSISGINNSDTTFAFFNVTGTGRYVYLRCPAFHFLSAAELRFYGIKSAPLVVLDPATSVALVDLGGGTLQVTWADPASVPTGLDVQFKNDSTGDAFSVQTVAGGTMFVTAGDPGDPSWIGVATRVDIVNLGNGTTYTNSATASSNVVTPA